MNRALRQPGGSMDEATPRIRVAHVALQLDTGGLERMLELFAAHTDRSRFDVRFISLTTRGRMASAIESHGDPVLALDARSGVRPGLIIRLARVLSSVDIVHTHNTKPLLYAGPAARLAGCRLIHTRHGQRHGATERQHRLFRLAARCADHIVCVSEESARRCIDEGVSRHRIKTIVNGVDIGAFAGLTLDARGPAVFVGRLSAEKNVETLLRAVAIVVRQRPGFRLRIAGDGKCREALEQLSVSLEVSRHVAFVGEVGHAAEALVGASMFVLPSLSEGLPVTVLEAMAAGLPVVAARVGGVPEVVVDGRTGLLVEAGDAAGLAHSIVQLLEDPDRARGMGSAGRSRAQTEFDVRTMVALYESLYEKLAGRSREAAA
jgi:glycosyltransferase involved in cell wall biosynthesis